MVHDYSAFLPGGTPQRREPTALERLGWGPAFASQIDVNALLGAQAIATKGIREDDAKGRHTTTRRELYATPSGCLVLDTPGMRELQLTDAATGIADVFEDIEALAASCRFNDCQHETEPGCTILAAIEDGSLDPARFNRWRKLQAEDAFNSASLAERREKDRAFGKLVRSAVKVKLDRKR